MANILLLLLILTFFFLNLISSDPQTDTLIDKICRENVDYGFCYKVFHENLELPSTDLIGLARITIDQASNNATNNLVHIADLYRHETDPKKHYLLMHCLYEYDGAVDNFDLASRYWNERNFVEMMNVERNAPYQMTQCINTFATDPDIGERNIQMINLMTMAIITAFNLNS